MTAVIPAKVSARTADGWRLVDGWEIWCPGCDDGHAVDATWAFNGDLERPTFEPSILVQWGRVAGQDLRCHSFLRDGVWEFLSDSTHALTGQRVPVVDHPKTIAAPSEPKP